MTVTIETFANGDTDYVAKLNSNFENVKVAVEVLQVDEADTQASTITAPLALKGMLGDSLTLIGADSYLPSASGSNLIVAPGECWVGETRVTRAKDTSTTLSFTGYSNGTYYLHLQPSGDPYVDTASSNALYSVVWSGSLSGITRIAKIAPSQEEHEAALTSTVLAATYASLDARLEAGEAAAAAKADGGMTTKSVAGSANVTLTSSEYKKRVIHLTGALTGNITVTAPAAAGYDWVVANLTSGAFTLTWKGSAGTGIVLTQDTRNHIYYDGSEMQRAAPAV